MPDDEFRPPLTVSRITTPKASDVLADKLRGHIRSGAWPEGLALPAERQLSEQTGLSRAIVREALRILEHEGLVEIRPGRGGGARVRRPTGDGLVRQLELFIWGRNICADHLHDVREALEALAARMAACNRTEADIADLVARTEAVEAAADDVSKYPDANLAWHMSVVRASHNELVVNFLEVVARAIHRAIKVRAFDCPDVRAQTLAIHRAILAAIVAGDADAAQRRMARHVTAARVVAFMQTDAAAIPIGARMSSQGSGGTERARARGKRSIGRKGTK